MADAFGATQSLLRQRPASPGVMRARLDRNRPSPMDRDPYGERERSVARGMDMSGVTAFMVVLLIGILVLLIINTTDTHATKKATQATVANTAMSATALGVVTDVNVDVNSTEFANTLSAEFAVLLDLLQGLFNASTPAPEVTVTAFTSVMDVTATRPVDPATNSSEACHVGFFGHNTDVDTGTVPEAVWPVGGLNPYPAVAEPLLISSTSATDAAPGGTGCRQLFISGVDDAFHLKTETIMLDGTSDISTVHSYTRINRAECRDVGSNGVNAGNIDGVTTPGGDILFRVPMGTGRAQQAFATVPYGRDACLYSIHADILRLPSVSTSVQVEVEIYMRYNTIGATASWERVDLMSVVARGSSSVMRVYRPCRPVDAKTDIRVVLPYVGQSNVRIGVSFDLRVERTKDDPPPYNPVLM